jgi:AraC-like DNA-binding protein
MRREQKIGRNDMCPCGSGVKYKRCCEGKIRWEEIFRSGADSRKHLSTRGRNIYFINRVSEILQLEANRIGCLEDYKASFTADAVRQIHEAVMEAWPPELDIVTALERNAAEVSGLYIGDYDLEYISRGIVRHSIYANKILVVDPFVYPTSVRDEYNPIIEPEQYRAQTLKNINFWFSLSPWIDAGILEIIRTPADFDRKLNWESLKRQKEKFERSPELTKALELSVEELTNRHGTKHAFQQLLLAAPDSYLERMIKELGLEKDGYTAKDFLKHIQAERDRDPDFLEPLGLGPESAQLHMFSSGTSYDIAQLTASITRSYLVTDLYVKWREIELDRESHNVESRLWSPFAKALQESPLKYFNSIRLEHALKLRNEGRLESLRRFFLRVWKTARTEGPFDRVNAQLLAEELREEIQKARDEWKQIDRDLVKIVGAELGAGLLAAGPLIASGHGAFVAAAAVAVGATTLAASTGQRKRFPDRFPAAFFMQIENEE